MSYLSVPKSVSAVVIKREGDLSKKCSGSIRTWQSRFFVLNDEGLTYWKDATARASNPKGGKTIKLPYIVKLTSNGAKLLDGEEIPAQDKSVYRLNVQSIANDASSPTNSLQLRAKNKDDFLAWAQALLSVSESVEGGLAPSPQPSRQSSMADPTVIQANAHKIEQENEQPLDLSMAQLWELVSDEDNKFSPRKAMHSTQALTAASADAVQHQLFEPTVEYFSQVTKPVLQSVEVYTQPILEKAVETRDYVNEAYAQPALERAVETRDYVNKTYAQPALEKVEATREYVTETYAQPALEKAVATRDYVNETYAQPALERAVETRDYVNKTYAQPALEKVEATREYVTEKYAQPALEKAVATREYVNETYAQPALEKAVATRDYVNETYAQPALKELEATRDYVNETYAQPALDKAIATRDYVKETYAQPALDKAIATRDYVNEAYAQPALEKAVETRDFVTEELKKRASDARYTVKLTYVDPATQKVAEIRTYVIDNIARPALEQAEVAGQDAKARMEVAVQAVLKSAAVATVQERTVEARTQAEKVLSEIVSDKNVQIATEKAKVVGDAITAAADRVGLAVYSEQVQNQVGELATYVVGRVQNFAQPALETSA